MGKSASKSASASMSGSASSSVSQSLNLLGRQEEVEGDVVVDCGFWFVFALLDDLKAGSSRMTKGTDAKEYVSEKTRGMSGILPRTPHFCFRAISISLLDEDLEFNLLAVADEDDDVKSRALLASLLVIGDTGAVRVGRPGMLRCCALDGEAACVN